MRTNPRRLTQLAILVVSLALVGACTSQGSPTASPAQPSQEPARAGSEPAAGGEAEEEGAELVERIEAFHEAQENGTAGVSARVASDPAAGWTGEHVVDPSTDDWEPAIAADPNAPFVYILVTRIGEPKPCPGNCPSAYIALERSTDGGRHVEQRQGRVPVQGVVAVRPDDRGRPEHRRGVRGLSERLQHGLPEVHRPREDVERTGQRLRQGLLDRQAGARGERQRPRRVPLVQRAERRRPVDGGVARLRRHVDADEGRRLQAVLLRLRRGCAAQRHGGLLREQHLLPGSGRRGRRRRRARRVRLREQRRHWRKVVVDTVDVGEPCISAGCGSDFYIGHIGVADESGRLLYVYDGATTESGPQQIWVKASSDGGLTWSPRTALSVAGEDATTRDRGDRQRRYASLVHADRPRRRPDEWNV